MRTSDLDDVCPTIGYAATRSLQEWYAGRSVYVPVAATPEHPLALLIGLPALRALVRDWPGEVIRVPGHWEAERYRRERIVAERLARGCSPGEVAVESGLTARRVQQMQVELQQRGWLEFAEFRSPGGRARRAGSRTPPLLRVRG